MRAAFIRALVEVAEQDERVVLLTGDLGYHAVEPFVERFRSRFINVGVAEQNMVGIATGMAEAGYVPYVYSINPFATLRPYEFIRNGPLLHNLPLRVVAMGGGFEYGSCGISHYGLEDLGVMRMQPRMMVVAPADHAQTETMVHATASVPTPVYMRLGKDDHTLVPGLDGRFLLGCGNWVGDGATTGDVLLVAVGAVASEAVAAARDLSERGVACAVYVVSTLNPPPTAELVDALRGFGTVMAVEEHYTVGGLGSLVAEVIAEHGMRCSLIRSGVTSMPADISGSQAYMRSVYGLTARQLAERAATGIRASASS